MKYRVFEGLTRCADYNISGWEIDTFDTKREAEMHAFCWAYPVNQEEAVNAPIMNIGEYYDFSMGDSGSVLMMIQEVDDESS